MNVGSCQPRGWDKPERLQAKATQAIETALHAGHGGGGIQGQELTFSSGPADGTHAVSWPAGQPDFIVPLAMEHHFGTLGGTVPQPGYETGMLLERPRAMPVRDHKQRRGDTAIATQLPEPNYTGAECRRHIMYGDEQHQWLRISR